MQSAAGVFMALVFFLIGTSCKHPIIGNKPHITQRLTLNSCFNLFFTTFAYPPVLWGFGQKRNVKNGGGGKHGIKPIGLRGFRWIRICHTKVATPKTPGASDWKESYIRPNSIVRDVKLEPSKPYERWGGVGGFLGIIVATTPLRFYELGITP